MKGSVNHRMQRRRFTSSIVSASAFLLPLLAGCNELGQALDKLNRKIDEWNGTTPPVVKRAALAKPVIEIIGNTVTFDGKPLVFTHSMDEWTAIIGPDFREDRRNDPKPGLRTWDKLGLDVLQDYRNVKVGERLVSRQIDSVIAMTFQLNDLPGRITREDGLDRPTQKFSGTFVINGAVFTARTSVKELNAQLKRALHFQRRDATLFSMLSPTNDHPSALHIRIETLPAGYTGLPVSLSISYPKKWE